MDDARRLMESAVVHLPNDPALLIYLAKMDIQDGRGAEAEKRLRHVLRADPSDTEALYNLASALRLQRRNDEAGAGFCVRGVGAKLADTINTVISGSWQSAADWRPLCRLLFAERLD